MLGSHYYVAYPTVKLKDIVAAINMDMYLPLFPLHYLEVQGLGESTLGNDIRGVAQLNDVEVQFDKQPPQNRFIRSDQASFVRQGIPGLGFKFGWTPDSPEQKIFNSWIHDRYHAPSDDLEQPVPGEQGRLGPGQRHVPAVHGPRHGLVGVGDHEVGGAGRRPGRLVGPQGDIVGQARYAMPRAFEPDRWLADGDQVTVGDLVLDVIHCPGHTPGHVICYHAPSKLALVGDVLFAGSIGRTDLPGGDYQAILDSLARVCLTLPDEVQVLPGHGPQTTVGAERASNPFLAGLVPGPAAPAAPGGPPGRGRPGL